MKSYMEVCGIFLPVFLYSLHNAFVFSRPTSIPNNFNIRYEPDVMASENISNTTISENGPLATLTFLKRFGYLEGKEGNDSEALYSEESIANAVRKMQKFGDLPQTGLMDKATIKLLSHPRCGVPDVEKRHSRSKRFTIASKGWDKRKLTYRFINWSSKLFHKNVEDDMAKAFNIWARYSQLQFVKATKSNQVDISVLFGRGYHNDGYPFDGPGGTLAHAYYPNNHGPLAGDIHFDEDENWISGPDRKNSNNYNTISFLGVATHELGHSLGLAHSHTRDSVMFPYYQSTNEEPQLAHDDIMAVYKLYIQRELKPGDEDESNENTGDTPTRKPIFTTKSYDEDHTTTRRVTTTQAPYIPHTEASEDEMPDLCKIQFDSISFFRNEMFITKGSYMWRLPEPKSSKRNSPFKISRLFSGLDGVEKIDAAYERDSDGKIVFFSGKSYWIFDGTKSFSGPRPLTDFGLPSSLQKLDAAFVWDKNHRTYFFSDNMYWRYNETLASMDKSYPQKITNWKGVPNDLNAAIRWKDGKSYFFKGNVFWRFDDNNVETEKAYPMKTTEYWFGCTE